MEQSGSGEGEADLKKSFAGEQYRKVLDLKRQSFGSKTTFRHKMRNIVTATKKFEAEHEECVRVLPYTKGDQVVVQCYVFSGESGIPEHLKLAAQECFGEMEVDLKWSDLYNDTADILKVTPLEYPSGEPKRLSASQIDEISEIINENLHVLGPHRNVTSMQASFKITKSKQTNDPCITIYVLGKGLVPFGESEFPPTLGPYSVDVVDGFWFRALWMPKEWTPKWTPQEQDEMLTRSVYPSGDCSEKTTAAITSAHKVYKSGWTSLYTAPLYIKCPRNISMDIRFCNYLFCQTYANQQPSQPFGEHPAMLFVEPLRDIFSGSMDLWAVIFENSRSSFGIHELLWALRAIPLPVQVTLVDLSEKILKDSNFKLVSNYAAPQQEVPLPKVAAAAASGPSDKMRNIVTATKKFEAEHEECVRVLPYTKSDQVVVQCYVFSGESGIPEHLKLAAQECFGEMEVDLEWSDLYNDTADILKVTPLEYPSGEPKRLSASQIDKISRIINENLHVLDRHRNVTSVQASFKITKSKQTNDPCITIYVLGKGLVPFGESEFPPTLGPYSVDVVDGFCSRAPWTPKEWTPKWTPQEQDEVLTQHVSLSDYCSKKTTAAITSAHKVYKSGWTSLYTAPFYMKCPRNFLKESRFPLFNTGNCNYLFCQTYAKQQPSQPFGEHTAMLFRERLLNIFSGSMDLWAVIFENSRLSFGIHELLWESTAISLPVQVTLVDFSEKILKDSNFKLVSNYAAPQQEVPLPKVAAAAASGPSVAPQQEALSSKVAAAAAPGPSAAPQQEAPSPEEAAAAVPEPIAAPQHQAPSPEVAAATAPEPSAPPQQEAPPSEVATAAAPGPSVAPQQEAPPHEVAAAAAKGSSVAHQQEAPSPEVAAAAAPEPSAAPQQEAPSPEVAAAASPEPSASPQQESPSPEGAASTASEPSAAPQQEAPSREVAAATAPESSVAPQQEAPSPEEAAATAPEPSGAPQQEAPSPEVAAAAAPEPSAASQHQFPSLEVAAVAAPKPTFAPQQEAPSPEVAAAAAPGPSVAPQQEAPSPEVAAAAAPESSAPSQQEAPPSEVATAAAPGPSAPQQEAPPHEVAAAAAPEPSVSPQQESPSPEVEVGAGPEPSELIICGPITTYNEASEPDCKDDIYRDPTDSVHSPMATHHEKENIVTATMKFEAEHEECVRVLPYIGDDKVVVQFYVFSAESGVLKRLKVAAKECFGEMKVVFKWLDLYNDAADILKVTPLQFPSGEPKRLSASQIDEIGEIINKNLNVLDEHRNVTSVQASLKIRKSKQTEIPCITIYVLGKGLIPVGESEFPRTLGPYHVDVVDGFWFRTDSPWIPNKAQEQSEVLRWGSSIGVQGQMASGTLGAIVADGSTVYALSCDHVIKHKKNKEIVHPSLEDHLNYLKYNLKEYRNWIEKIIERGSDDISDIKFSVDNLEEWNELSEKFKWLQSMKERHLESDRWTPHKKEHIEMYEKALERRLNPPRIIGEYITGVFENFEWTDGNEYFIDVAIAKLTDEEVNSLRKSETAEMIEQTDHKPSGECSPTETGAIVDAEELCKSGRGTGFTTARHVINTLVDSPHFMKSPKFQIKANERLPDVSTRIFFCQSCQTSQNNPRCKSCQKDIQLGELWHKNCLCIASGKKAFADAGDSGAVIFERKSMSGFGVIFAVHDNAHKLYAIAFPLEVALKALSGKISKDSNLRLVSDYETLPNQAPPQDALESTVPGPNATPQQEAPSPELAAAAAPEPSDESAQSSAGKRCTYNLKHTWKRGGIPTVN